ncbi:MAG TPA: hypothetical protein QGG93_08785 [Verrucomicrobiota bacterium]|nr:hypothetical protein [Verrucomicrobiota bacterium]
MNDRILFDIDFMQSGHGVRGIDKSAFGQAARAGGWLNFIQMLK